MIEREKSLQERMRQNDKTALDFIYREYKEGFINYALRFQLSKDHIEDVFQDSIIALYQSFATKKTTLKTSSLKTYLYGIAKNIIYTQFNKKENIKEVNDTISEDYDNFEIEEPTLEEHLLAKHFKNLSASCKEVLRLYYYRGLSIKEIVEGTNYKDENTVKSHKSRCLKGLKQKITED